MSETKLQLIEEKLAYLELANDQLEEQILRQQRELDTLAKAQWDLAERLEQVKDDQHVNAEQTSQRPPHY